ncbi:T9SS type A sorting domain-containing protein [Bacteroidota bacterium]
MKKARLLLLTISLSLVTLGINAQDTIRSLVISEWRGGEGPGQTYIELSNMGDESLDLSKFLLQWVNGNGSQLAWEDNQWRFASPANTGKYYMSGILDAGETYLIVNGRSGPRADLLAIADDTVFNASSFKNLLFNYGNHKHLLYYFLDNGDSIVVDVANLTMNENLKTTNDQSDVAGIPEATRYNTIVRKASINQGNADWESSKGITAEDSEWLVIPNQPTSSEISFTTPGNHGTFEVSLGSDDVDINVTAGTMSVPWAVYKDDSLLTHLTIGSGMAWTYIQDTTSFADSAHTKVQDGDIFTAYAVGNELKKVDFTISVKEALVDQTMIYPLMYKDLNVEGDANPWMQPYSINDKLYFTDTSGWYTDTSGFIFDTTDYVTDPITLDTIGYVFDTVGYIIDTIGPIIDTLGRMPDRIDNVAFGTRVDTLFKYLEKAPNATWEIVWSDGIERADLMAGDILRVTAEDGTTVKDYDIEVREYAASNNVQLGAITWPDKADFIEGWMGDTIPQFDPNKTVYNVTLPYGTTSVPALTAHPQDVNTRLDISPAASVSGSIDKRTTLINVMSENPEDSINKVYTVIFEVEKDPTKIQHYVGEPFISEIVTVQYSWMSYLEIVNPGTKPLDLSEYIMVRGNDVIPATDIASLIPEVPTEDDFQNRYRSYVPGYKYHEDTINWMIEPGILSLDSDINPIVEPGDVFIASAAAHGRYTTYTDKELAAIDKVWYNGTISSSMSDEGVNVKNSIGCLKRGAESIYLFRIDNDSILEGSKPVGDPFDYTLVDMIGDPVMDGLWSIAGGSYTNNRRSTTRRKPHIYHGVKDPFESLIAHGTHADTSDWIYDQFGTANNDQMTNYIGSHVMDPVTVYMSTVSSPVYLVSDGFAGVQTIQGDLTSTNVSVFFGNVTKADPNQAFSLHSAANGSVKADTDAVAENDTLVVVSADSVNTTTYVLINLPIDDNANLELVDANSGLTIEALTDSTGSITGVVYGSLLKDVKDAVKTVSDNAVMNIINGEGKLIPLKILDEYLEKADTKVGNDIYFIVTAQDKVTVMKYKLEPAILSSDAFVISALYSVDQVANTIDGLADATSISTFFSNIEVVEGATAKVLSKLGHERMEGEVAYDDVLQVISEDGSTTRTYFITFVNETSPDSNGAPEITLAFSDSTIAVPGSIMISATAEDDGLPPPANLTYMWEVTSNNASDVVIETADALETNVTFAEKADYTLTLSVSDGALTSTANVNVTVGIIGVESNLTPALRLYPNPAKDKLKLELMNIPEKSAIVSIYNVTGSAVFNMELSSKVTEIDVSGYESGLYFIKVTSGQRSYIQSVQIQN